MPNEKLTMQELQTAYPDLYKEIVAAAQKESFVAGRTEGLIAGASGERQRIKDVRSQLIAGHEVLIEEMVDDGKTTGPEAAVRVLAAEKETRNKHLENYQADGKEKVPNAPGKDVVDPPDGETAKNQREAGEKLDAFAKAIREEQKCSYSEALAKAKAAHPKLAEMYS
jgi:hypothetical protein